MATETDLDHKPTASLLDNKQRAKSSERKLVDNQGEDRPERRSKTPQERAPKGAEKMAKSLTGRSTDFDLVEGRGTDALGLLKGKVRKEAKADQNVKRKPMSIQSGGNAGRSDVRPSDLTIPVVRSKRLSTPDGRTSFHFSHDYVSKTAATSADANGRVNRPGAAKAHGNYIERESAVALDAEGVEIAVDRGPDQSAGNDNQVASNDNPQSEVAGDGVPPVPVIKAEESTHVVRRPDRSLVARVARLTFGIYEPHSLRNVVGLDALRPLAGLRFLPGIAVVRDDAEAALLLQGDAVRELGVGYGAGVDVRRARGGDRGDDGGTAGLKPSASPAAQGSYIERQEAMARQPDGSRVLFTNIDDDAEKRAEFWRLVEKNERAAAPDRMTFTIGDNPNFWADLRRRKDCPKGLSDAIVAADPAKAVTVQNSDNTAMRAYLAKQPGWVGAERKTEEEAYGQYAARQQPPMAKFHDGRGGRVQYRIIGELPHELDVAGRASILREFSAEFEKRKLPYVAVMHAPDHTNNDKNWHFHLVYYDRPAKRITIEQIVDHVDKMNKAPRKPMTVDESLVGRWDFDVEETYVRPGRAEKRTNFPFAQDKVKEVAQDKKWIEVLRTRLASITNDHLERADIGRRLDPRTHEEMGIHADPQEHLGTRLANLEAMGIATPRGVTNEEKQWTAVLERLDKDLERRRAEVERTAKKWLQQIDRSPLDEEGRRGVRGQVTRWHQHRIESEEHDAIAERVGEHKERTLSRAMKVKETCERHLKAIEDGKASRYQASRQSALIAKVDEARDHLAWAVGFLKDEETLISDCRDASQRERGIADMIARAIDKSLAAQVKREAPAVERIIPEDGKRKPAEKNREEQKPAMPVDGRATLIKAEMDAFIAGIVRDKRRLVREDRQLRPAVLTEADMRIVTARNYTAMAQHLKPVKAAQDAAIAEVVAHIAENPQMVVRIEVAGREEFMLTSPRRAMVETFAAYADDPAIRIARDAALAAPTVATPVMAPTIVAPVRAGEGSVIVDRRAAMEPAEPILPPQRGRTGADEAPTPPSDRKAPAEALRSPRGTAADAPALAADAPANDPSAEIRREASARHAVNERIARAVLEEGRRVRIVGGVAQLDARNLAALAVDAERLSDPALQKRLIGIAEVQARDVRRITAYARAHPDRVVGVEGRPELSKRSPRELVEIAARYREDRDVAIMLEAVRGEHRDRGRAASPILPLESARQPVDPIGGTPSPDEEKRRSPAAVDKPQRPATTELVPDLDLRAQAMAYAAEQARIAEGGAPAEVESNAPRISRTVRGADPLERAANYAARRAATVGAHPLIDGWLKADGDGLDAEARGRLALRIVTEAEPKSKLKDIDRQIARRIRDEAELARRDAQPGLGLDIGRGPQR